MSKIRKMNLPATNDTNANLHKIQQTVKWAVYIMLLANFGLYIQEDWSRAAHTITSASTLWDWTSEFATSIDESAWFILLFLLELDTYVLDDEQASGWVTTVIRGLRILCIVMIAHTIVAFTNTIIDYGKTVPVENVSDLCHMTDADVSYVYNLEYTEVNKDTCDGLSDASRFYWMADDPVVSDMPGLKLERDLAWADLAEAVIWLVILLSIEVVVRQQDKGITGGSLISSLNRMKLVLYASLLAIGVYWAYLSHWMYLWDEILWIGGFAAIEMNVNEWRHELLDEKAAA
jgi:hypothetical protein